MSPSIRHARAYARLCLPLFFGLMTLPLCGPVGGAAPAPSISTKDKDLDPVVPNFEVRFIDGTSIRVRLIDKELPLKTPFGKLVIPTDKITEIECATRVPEGIAKRVKSAISRLGSEGANERKAAQAELVKLQRYAFGALLEAAESNDAEVRLRARGVLDTLRQTVSEEQQAVFPSDVVHTADSKIAGRLECDVLRVETSQFGEVRLKLSDARTLVSLSVAREKPVDALPDPGQLSFYQNQAGKVLAFQVTGAAAGFGRGGNIWGTGTYTIDSTLSLAAVHAGVLKPGKSGVVKVKILPLVNGFTGSVQNGVQSHQFQAMAGYEILKK